MADVYTACRADDTALAQAIARTAETERSNVLIVDPRRSKLPLCSLAPGFCTGLPGPGTFSPVGRDSRGPRAFSGRRGARQLLWFMPYQAKRSTP